MSIPSGISRAPSRSALIAREACRRHHQHRLAGGGKVGVSSASYAVSKAAVLHMTKAQALEWARHGIRVNAICPGYIHSEMTDDYLASPAGQEMIRRIPQRRAGDPSDLDGALAAARIGHALRFHDGCLDPGRWRPCPRLRTTLMDFSLSPEIEALRLKVRAFVAEHVIPLEADRANYDAHENIRLDVLKPLREKAKAAGLWAPQMPKARGGLGLPMVGWAAFYEEANRSIFGPLVFNCAAPDDGNMNVLNKVLKTDAQKDAGCSRSSTARSARPS